MGKARICDNKLIEFISLNNIYLMKFQYTKEMYNYSNILYTYNVQWYSETSYQTYVNLSPY